MSQQVIHKKQRNRNLDLIRCVAVLSVIGVHFFYHNAFVERPMAGMVMYAMTVVRTFFMICVPLFALLSGYLCGHKKPGWGYMGKLIPVLLTYLLCGIATLAFRNLVLDAGFSKRELLTRIVTLNAVPYGWYVGMYVGLYLLIPFLNAAWQGLPDRKARQLLLVTMGILTIAPNWLNTVFPGEDGGYLTILPTWWEDLWPVTYYFLGAYLKEYGAKVSRWKLLLCLTVSLVVCGAYNYLRSAGGPFYQPFGSNWGGFQNTLHAVLVFILLLNLDLNRMPGALQWPVRWISRMSLAIYLCSWISDTIVYTWLIPFGGNQAVNLLRLPVTVLCSLVLAAVMAQVVTWVQSWLEGLWKKTVHR